MLLVAWGSAAVANSTPPIDRATLLLVRALAYDRAIEKEHGGLKLLVVAGAERPVEAEQALQVVDGLRGVTVAGRALAKGTLVLSGPTTDWSTTLVGYDAVIVGPGLGEGLAPLALAADQLDVVLLALDAADMGHGPTLGVELAGGSLSILLDRTAAVAQGADLAGELLEIVRVVGTP